MSREFGSYMSGYFHFQMETAADDCLQGSDEMTRLWGAFLKEFSTVAYTIASSEAGDAYETDTILQTIKQLPELKRRLRDIENHVATYEQVMQYAIREYQRAQSSTEEQG